MARFDIIAAASIMVLAIVAAPPYERIARRLPPWRTGASVAQAKPDIIGR
jgi:hypothetical protein